MPGIGDHGSNPVWPVITLDVMLHSGLRVELLFAHKHMDFTVREEF